MHFYFTYMNIVNMKSIDKVQTTLVSITQCVIYLSILSLSISFGKEFALLVLFRLLRRIFKQFRINRPVNWGVRPAFLCPVVKDCRAEAQRTQRKN